MQKRHLRQEKGITLIALVITIIVMLILVTVTINIAIKGSLFDYAKQAKERYIFEEAQEQLEIDIAYLKMQILLNNNSDNQTNLNDLKTYLEDPKFNGEYLVELMYEPLATTENVLITPVYAKVTHVPTQYVFYIDNSLIVIGGESGNTLKLKFTNIETEERTIKVIMEATQEVEEYKYYKSLDGNNYVLVGTSAENEYIYNDLELDTQYYLKVVCIDSENQEATATSTAETTYNIYVGDVNAKVNATFPLMVSTNRQSETIVEFEYASSNEQIATVDQSGNVTTIAAGEAIITVRDKTGKNAVGQCTITVETQPLYSDYENGVSYTLAGQNGVNLAFTSSGWVDDRIYMTSRKNEVYFQWDATNAFSPTKLKLCAYGTGSGWEPPAKFSITCSNDVNFSNFVVLMPETNYEYTEGAGTNEKNYTFESKGAYRYYRINVITWAAGNGGDGANVSGCILEE